MSSQLNPSLTPDQYLAIERDCEQKHEFFRGEMFAMGGASAAHNVIAVNVTAALHGQLRERDCFVYSNDMRVHVPATGLYTYPDGIVTCDKPKFQDDHFDTLLNPQVIVEVLSPSTEVYDCSKKFEHYRSIPSLRHYLLIRQDYALVVRHSCDDQGEWSLRDFRGLEATLELPVVDCQLSLAEVFAKVEFPELDEQELAKAGLYTRETDPGRSDTV